MYTYIYGSSTLLWNVGKSERIYIDPNRESGMHSMARRERVLFSS